MTSPAGPDLPLPIALLARRARNAKSAKERHDVAYFAWEASVRLAVAARPPADRSRLARPSMGDWVAALDADGATPLDAPPLLATLAHLAHAGTDRRLSPRRTTARELLDALPAYRNAVLGHGSTRAREFYEAGGRTLLDGLLAAWSAGVFLARTADLVYVEAVEVDARGARRARQVRLTGLAPALESAPGGDGAGHPVRDDVRPRQLYLRQATGFTTLHPWLVYEDASLRERVLFWNGRGRGAQLLDFVSGELLRGPPLGQAFPSLEADMDAVLRASGSAPDAPAITTAVDAPGGDPSRLGDYTLLGKIGQGGMGVVYLARQEGLERLVALKTLPLDAAQDPTALARFDREVTALSRCDHPHVVKVLASGEAQGTRYYAMELVLGADLAQVAAALPASAGDLDAAVSSASEGVRRRREETLAGVPDLRASGEGIASQPAVLPHDATPRDRALRLAALFRDAARGVHHLHEAGIVHRDLKPANLMLTEADHRIVVMDLGLAALGDATRSITRDRTALLGTLRYMPPEQLQRNLVSLDRRADVYSLGATFYELLTDRRFLDGDSEARLVEQVLRESPPPAERAGKSVPRDLSLIVAKATEKDPARRYETAAALADDLDAFLDGRPIAARAPTLGYVLRLAIARNRAVAATALAAMALLLVGAGLFLAREGRLRREAEDRRADAVRLSALAEAREHEARSEREKAIARLDEVLRLSDVKRLADYEAEAETFWPASGDRVPAMRAWIAKAEALVARLPEHRRKLASLREAALPYDDEDRTRDRETHPDAPLLRSIRREREARKGDPEDPSEQGRLRQRELAKLYARIEELERNVEERRTFRFAGEEAQWWHDTLAGLVAGLERFTAEGATETAVPGALAPLGAGTLPSIRTRLAFAETIHERTVERHRAAWDALVAAVADARRCPRYRGLRLEPLPGLIPLGIDPRSGLAELADAASGAPPVRDADGRLAVADDMGIVFVLLPAATFRMGAVRPEDAAPGETNVDPLARDDEGPPHDHPIAPFLLSKYELTQAQWQRIMGNNPSQFGPGDVYGEKELSLSHPIEQVSHDDLVPCLRRLGLRLPTEAEWEYAARAGSTTPFPTGPNARTLEGSVNICDRFCAENGGPAEGWPYERWLDDGYTAHAPVGRYRPNAFGLHDMQGNVAEWCDDVYSATAYVRYLAGDLRSPAFGTRRTARGGSWRADANACRSALRSGNVPSYRSASMGFRPARDLG